MKKIKKITFVGIITVIVTLLIAGIVLTILLKKDFFKKIAKIEKNLIDDWSYKSEQNYYDSVYSSFSSSSTGKGVANFGVMTESASFSASGTSSNNNLGFTVGGASNIKNFRENIKNNYLPLSTDITYNGLYSEYYFDTGSNNSNNTDVFYPSYSCAVSKDPISNEKEYYMSVGLNSNLKESDFKRDKLNLVIVLDISGSMSSSFNSYYYDGNKNNEDIENKTKMRIAEECINNLLDKLNEDDRFGIVLFDDTAYQAKKITTVSETDMEAIKGHLLEVEAQGGTNFSAGYESATDLFDDELVEKNSEYQNRIIVLTDAMPNLGSTNSSDLMTLISDNADNEIFTSFVGIGVDFNTELTEKLSNVKGSNYYSVHNSKEFKKILAEDFDYMVTPLIFDLDLKFDSDNFEIENVYGSDSINKSTGEIMHINTLFPSSSNSDGDVKGGIVVLKLKKKNNNNDSKISLKISYKDVEGKNHSNESKVNFKTNEEEHYDNKGIQKAIVLARYVNALKNWIIYEKSKKIEFLLTDDTGIKEFDYDENYIVKLLGEHERQSAKLTVSENYKETFKKMKLYLESENKVLNDKSLEEEIKILDKLSK